MKRKPVRITDEPRGHRRELTEAQSRVLSCYRSQHAVRRVWPSIREVQKALGFKSPQAVMSHVAALLAKGYMARGERGAARTLIALPDPDCRFCPECGRRYF